MQRCLAFSELGIVFGAYLKDFSIPSLRCFSYLSPASKFQITYASCFWLYRNPLLVRWVMSCECIFLAYIGNSYHLPLSYSFPYVGKVLGLWETEFLPLPPPFCLCFWKRMVVAESVLSCHRESQMSCLDLTPGLEACIFMGCWASLLTSPLLWAMQYSCCLALKSVCSCHSWLCGDQSLPHSKCLKFTKLLADHHLTLSWSCCDDYAMLDLLCVLRGNSKKECAHS